MSQNENGCLLSAANWIRVFILLVAFAILGIVALLSLRVFLAPPPPTPTPLSSPTPSPTATPSATLKILPTLTTAPSSTPIPTNTPFPTRARAAETIVLPTVIKVVPIDVTTPTMPRGSLKPTQTPATAPTTSAPIATQPPTSGYPYEVAFVKYQNNCGHTWVEGTVWDANAQPQAGVRVEIDLYGNKMERTTGYHPRSAGYWEFVLDDKEPEPRDLFFHITLLDEAGNQLSERVAVTLTEENCYNEEGKQVAIVDFKRR